MAASHHRCALALGGNLGDRLANLQQALRLLAPAVAIEAVSPLYESDPVGPPGQPAYYNAACLGHTLLEPLELLRSAKAIERALGRQPGERWGPRPIDIDILLFDGLILDTPELTIPHPRLLERPFVLTPLADMAPDLIVPGSGLRVAAASARTGRAGLRRLAGPEWADATPGDPRPAAP